jgi:rubredoxin
MAAYDDVLYDEYRCRKCNHVWRVEVGRRAGRE